MIDYIPKKMIYALTYICILQCDKYFRRAPHIYKIVIVLCIVHSYTKYDMFSSGKSHVIYHGVSFQ